MGEITVEHKPNQKRLDELGVYDWGIWSKEVSEFPWSYEAEETCYFLQGQVTVTTDNGETVTMGQGDLVTFPQGLSCVWKILQPVKKHYRFS